MNVIVLYTTPFGHRNGTLKDALDYATMVYDASGFTPIITDTRNGANVKYMFTMSNKAVLV